MKVLYCAIGFCKNRNEQRMKMYLMYLKNMQQTERKIQIIKKRPKLQHSIDDMLICVQNVAQFSIKSTLP